MSQRWQRNPQQKIEQVAHRLYQNRLLLGRSGDAKGDWEKAETIVKNPLRHLLFSSHRPLIRLEKNLLEPILTWAENQALLSLLGLLGNIGLIFAVVTYVGAEKQRRDSEVLTAWQTLTNAHGQPGNAGRITALEFLNASPGANWRRRSICLWVCAWPRESLAGIDLSVEVAEQPRSDDGKASSIQPSRVFLVNIQLPNADLREANLESADLLGANLEGAVLWAVNLERAFLLGANLEGAFLESVNLERASLENANLEGASLENANLKRANLEGANLEGANLWNANLAGGLISKEQLSQAKLCQTKLPSYISLNSNRDCEEIDL